MRPDRCRPGQQRTPEYALIDLASGKPFGQASYLNIDPAAGSIEVGGIVYAPAFQRGIAATEAMYLMMRHVFDELGYRRYAWQCNSLNARSRAAATRLGFKFEGVWRQANVHKARNRDTRSPARSTSVIDRAL